MDSAQGVIYLAPFFGDLSQSEKLSENKPPLKVHVPLEEDLNEIMKYKVISLKPWDTQRHTSFMRVFLTTDTSSC